MLADLAWKPLAAVVALALLWTVEHLRPRYTGRQAHGRHYAENAVFARLNAFLNALVLATLVRLVADRARAAGFGLLPWLELPVTAEWFVASTLFRLAVVPLLGLSFEQLLLYETALLPAALCPRCNRPASAVGWNGNYSPVNA